MRVHQKKSGKLDNNISKTGYRALFLLMQLLNGPKSRTELKECAANDFIVNKDFSKDTITNTINILKKSGCIISRPSLKTNNKYVLKFQPYAIDLSDKQIEALHNFRKNISDMGDWKMFLEINELYGKLIYLTQDSTQRSILLYDHPFNHLSLKTLRALEISIRFGQLLNIKYKSPTAGSEDFDIIPKVITLENEKVYVWCYNFKYETTSFLRVDKIIGINSFTFDKDIVKKKDKYNDFEFTAVYELRGESASVFYPIDGERIIEENPDKEFSLKIEIISKNKFSFFQRILSYGSDCRLLSPELLRKEFIQNIKSIKSGYVKNEK